MRNVKRSRKPQSLASHAARYTRELLAAIEKAKSNGTKVADKHYNKYKQDDVQESLRRMYRGRCCYCEATIGVVSYDHIEHRKPKRAYPDLCFDWDNLHLACEKCNKHKGKKFNSRAEILDAAKDLPISDHLTYKNEWREPITARGRTTVRHADLNRGPLRKARVKVLLRTMELIGEINNRSNDPRTIVTRDQLASLRDSEDYGSLIGYAMATFLR